jgi:iron complex outermembrane recepter protein
VRTPSRLPVLLAVALVGAPLPPLHGQEPGDTVSIHEPVIVRVLRGVAGAGGAQAVSVVSGPELTRGHPGAYLEEALRAVPGLQVQNRYNLASGERVAVRGFGGRAQFGIRGLRVLVDGIPATLPDGQTSLDHVDMSAVERVELLRGPASTLYGNAAGGVLHFRSAAPGPVAGGGVRATAGADGLRVFSGHAGGGWGETRARVAASRYTFDGFRPDPAAADGSTYGRQERVVVNGVAERAVGDGALRFVLNALDLRAENPGSLTRAALDAGDRSAHAFSVLQQTREDIRQGQAGLTWRGPLGGIEGEFSSWGVLRDFEGRIPPTVVAFDRRTGGVRALATGRHSSAGGWSLAAGGGVEAEVQSDDRENWRNEGGRKGARVLEQDERVWNVGTFAHARLEPGGELSLLAGVRYDLVRFRVRDRFQEDGTDDSGSRSMQALSPSVGVVWRPAERVELFGSVATAFETPTTTELANRPSGAGGFNPDLDPTRSRALEAGVRTGAAGRWSVEATAFRVDLEDELVPFEVPDVPGRTYYRNAGESRHEGWELSGVWSAGAGVRLRIAWTHVDARFGPQGQGEQALDGKRIPGLARDRVDGVLGLDRGGGFVELRGIHQGAIPVDDLNRAWSPAFALWDLRVGLHALRLGSRVSVAPFAAVTNLAGRSYDTSVVVNAAGGRYFEPGPGRTLQVGASVVAPGGA